MSAQDRSDLGMHSSVRTADRGPVVRVGALEKIEDRHQIEGVQLETWFGLLTIRLVVTALPRRTVTPLFGA